MYTNRIYVVVSEFIKVVRGMRRQWIRYELTGYIFDKKGVSLYRTIT